VLKRQLSVPTFIRPKVLRLAGIGQATAFLIRSLLGWHNGICHEENFSIFSMKAKQFTSFVDEEASQL
jgi:hypothetical protein